MLREPRFEDPYLLAARFVVFESGKTCGAGSLDFVDIGLMPSELSYRYQAVRVYAGDRLPRVEFVIDEWTSKQELEDADRILRQAPVGTDSRLAE